MPQPPTHRPTNRVRIGCDGAGTSLIILHGEVDLGASTALRHAFTRAAHHADGHVAVDAREVTFVDAGGMSALLSAAAACGRCVFLRAPSPAMRRIAELAGGLGPDRWRGTADIGDVRLA